MKNTNNLLITGVALAIALFTSVQVVAMENRAINPHLTDYQRRYLESTIDGIVYRSEKLREIPVSQRDLPRPEGQTANVELMMNRRMLRDLEEKYYGNRAYTDKEIHKIKLR